MPCYVKENPYGRMFICGEMGPHCAECGDCSSFLCDYPVGDSKTCDRPLCEAHANPVAPNMHYCTAHMIMWKAYLDSGGVQRQLDNVLPFRGACQHQVPE